MHELVCNLHIHSTYSDGTGSYSHIANQALQSNLDVVIITDHNIKVKGVEKYYHKNGRKVLLLTGEEVHDPDRIPQKSHTLVIGCEEEMAQFAPNPQTLIDYVNRAGGSTFLAHPFEYELSLFNETAITWENWEVSGFTGLELWNGFSEFKTVVRSFRQALYYAFFPELISHQPLPQMIAKWDELLLSGQKVFAVGGSDSHALHYKKGLIRKTIFPYSYHFSTINTHLLLSQPLTGNVDADKGMIYNSLRNGSSFIGNDLPYPTRGFTFTSETGDEMVSMGEEMEIKQGATIRINLPRPAEIRLIHNGVAVQNMKDSDRMVLTVTEAGFYRVEAYLDYAGGSRGWIFSNPIFLRTKKKPGKP